MTFIRYKEIGNQTYAYEITAYYDKKTKTPKQKTKYLGLVKDKKNKIFEKQQRRKPEKLLLDFGDSYLVQEILRCTGYSDILKELFEEQGYDVLALLAYRLCHNAAMMHAHTWFEGNCAKIFYKKADLHSQRISDLLKILGEEVVQRMFFNKYFSKFSSGKNGIIIDGTSIPNQIHNPLTACGRSGEEIDMQMRFLLVVDKVDLAPLFFRCLQGNIVDVSVLTNTIEELRAFGIKETYIYTDAGFFSEENIREMYNHQLQFLTRLPAGRIIFKELMKTELEGLELSPNRVKYGKRGLFVKQKKIKLFDHEAYAHIVLDPKRKGRELSRLVSDSLEDKTAKTEDLDYQFQTAGIMVLISSFDIPKEEVVPAYYVRQTAEVLFGFSKDDLDLVPLRVHSEQAIRGFLFLQFMTLIAFTQIKKKLSKEYSVDEALNHMKNLKAKVYDNEILISELTKEQKVICEKTNVIVPKTLGI